jgi:hypothetical protein
VGVVMRHSSILLSLCLVLISETAFAANADAIYPSGQSGLSDSRLTVPVNTIKVLETIKQGRSIYRLE